MREKNDEISENTKKNSNSDIKNKCLTNVNIAGYQLGRKDNSDIAIGIVRLDSEPSPDIIEQISDLDEVISATIISFD